MICKYCEQPIYETEQTEVYGGKVYMRGKYRHIENDAWDCKQVNKNNPYYENPRCSICKTETNKHSPICSVCGIPKAHAWPIKE